MLLYKTTVFKVNYFYRNVLVAAFEKFYGHYLAKSEV